MSQNPAVLLKKTYASLNEAQMDELAYAVSRLCAGHDRVRIYLHGHLGAGKTTWVRLFLRHMGVPGRIKSPSFSVVESYEESGQRFHHLDFYRQSEPATWQAGGIRDLLAEPGIALVEWPEHAPGLPAPHIELWLARSIEGPHVDAEDERTVQLCIYGGGDGPFGSTLPAQWSDSSLPVTANRA